MCVKGFEVYVALLLAVCLFFVYIDTGAFAQGQAEINCRYPGQDPDPKHPTIDCPVQGATGLVNIQMGVSCDRIGDSINCGGDKGTATTLELSLTPGGKDPFTYTFVTLAPADLLQPRVGTKDVDTSKVGNDTMTNTNCIYSRTYTVGDPDPTGATCLVSRKMELTIESLEPTVAYPLTRLSLEIPHAYTGHHSNTYMTHPGHTYTSADDIDDDYTKLSKGAACDGKSAKFSVNAEAFRRNIRPNHPFYDKNSPDLLPFLGIIGTEDCTHNPLYSISNRKGYFDSPVVMAVNYVRGVDGDHGESNAPWRVCTVAAYGGDRTSRSCWLADSSACPDKNNWCSPCSQYSRSYFFDGHDEDDDVDDDDVKSIMNMGFSKMHLINDMRRPTLGKWDDSDPFFDDDDHRPVFTPSFFRCPLEEAWGYVKNDDDELYPLTRNDRHATDGFDNRALPNDCDSNSENSHAQRRFCSSACHEKFQQDLNSLDVGRTWAGSVFITGPVYKGMDDCGTDEDDDDSTGVDMECISTCEKFPGINLIDCWDSCISDRPTCVDDGDDDDARAKIVDGPYVNWIIDPVIGNMCGMNTGALWPTTATTTRKGPWPFRTSDGSGRRPSKKVNDDEGDDADISSCIVGVDKKCVEHGDDDMTCSIDDDWCVETNSFKDKDVWIAACPSCGCVSLENQPFKGASFSNIFSQFVTVGSDSICDENLFGSGASSESVLCNAAYPDYLADREGGVPGGKKKGAIWKHARKLNDDDGTELFNYPPSPFNVCPFRKRSRIGTVGAFDTISDGHSPTKARFYDTAEAIGLLMPYCTAYRIGSPVPMYSMNVTLRDISGSEEIIRDQFIRLTNIQNGVGAKATGSSIDSVMYAEVRGMFSTSGPIGREIGGMLVICNAYNGTDTKTWHPPSHFDMATGPSFEDGFKNPWPDLLKKQSNVDRSNPNINQTSDKLPYNIGDLPGVAPLPHIIAGDKVPEGAWWFVVPPRDVGTYGEGCGQIGAKNTLFRDAAQSKKACNLDPYACAAGMDPDWTNRQRNRDSDGTYFRDDDGDPCKLDDSDRDCGYHKKPREHTMHGSRSGNNKHYERHRRDTSRVKTPCMVSSMYTDMMTMPKDCETYRHFLEKYGVLPVDFVDGIKEAHGSCTPPHYWIQLSSDAFVSDIVLNSGSLSLRADITIADAILLDESSVLASGRFTGVENCFVMRGGIGSLQVEIENTDPNLSGSYVVFGTCTEGVTIVTSPSNTEVVLSPVGKPGSKSAIVMDLKQSGLLTAEKFGGATPTCTLTLSSPSVLGAIALDIEKLTCEIGGIGESVDIVVAEIIGGTDCEVYDKGCHTSEGTMKNDSSVNVGSILALVGIGLLALVGLFMYHWEETQYRGTLSRTLSEKEDGRPDDYVAQESETYEEREEGEKVGEEEDDGWFNFDFIEKLFPGQEPSSSSSHSSVVQDVGSHSSVSSSSTYSSVSSSTPFNNFSFTSGKMSVPHRESGLKKRKKKKKAPGKKWGGTGRR